MPNASYKQCPSNLNRPLAYGLNDRHCLVPDPAVTVSCQTAQLTDEVQSRGRKVQGREELCKRKRKVRFCTHRRQRERICGKDTEQGQELGLHRLDVGMTLV